MAAIYGGTSESHETRLSNLTYRPFIFDNVRCTSIESILQSFKVQDGKRQIAICALSGNEARRAGQCLHSWKTKRLLWWNNYAYRRNKHAYLLLITRVFDTVYEQDTTFRNDLLMTRNESPDRSVLHIGPEETTLTEVERLYQINRLRTRALREQKSFRFEFPSFSGIPKFQGVKKDGSPVTFLRVHYAAWLASGLLTQLNLRRYDKKLFESVKYEMRKHGKKLADTIPPGINR